MENRGEMKLPYGFSLVLASGSPRRKELIGMLQPSFRTITPPDIIETYPSELKPCEVPEYLSKLKALACDFSGMQDNELVITADTVVIIDNKILGKPHSREEAIAMLESLSGRKHTVITGVSITDKKREIHSFSDSTDVFFSELDKDDIERYVDIYRPYDKAGAYGIQEWIGAVGIKRVDGCFYNVMGLPIAALYRNLAKIKKEKDN